MSEATELLELREAATAGPVRPDGLVPMHIIRPGIGKGRGRHLYEASMLEHEVNDGRFKGWKMYVDHQSPEAKKMAAGLPRSIRDLAGIVQEAWWDPSLPANPATGHAQGGVVGLAKVNRFMRSLIEDIPEAIGASISAQATSVKPRMIGGQQVWLVEGINPRGSVDFVTEAGAGGKVASLLEHALQESWFDDEEAITMLESLTNEEIAELLEAERPDVVSVLIEARNKKADPDGDGGENVGVDPDEDGDGDKGRKRPVRETEGDATVADIKELLTEALDTDEGREILEASVNAAFQRIVAPKLGELIEAALEDERELIQADANAVADRRLEVRDLRDFAHGLINESKLPDTFKSELRAKYDIVEKKPTSALDVVETKDGDDAKSAEDILREAVETDIAAKREQVAAINPTMVRGQGPRSEKALAEGEENKDTDQKTTGSPLTDHLLQEAKVGNDELSDLYDGIV